MKVQLEVFLTSVHLHLLTPSLTKSKGIDRSRNNDSSNSKKKSSSLSAFNINLAKEELALESLLEFCREPSLMEDLYTNYDCDVQCTNLFDSIINVLCARAVPSNITPLDKNKMKNEKNNIKSTDRGTSSQKEKNNNDSHSSSNNKITIGILNKIALDGIFAVLQSIAVKCEKSSYSMTRKNVRNSMHLLTTSLSTESAPVVGVNDDVSVISSAVVASGVQIDRTMVVGGKDRTIGTEKERGTGQEDIASAVDRWCGVEEHDSKNISSFEIKLNDIKEKNCQNVDIVNNSNDVKSGLPNLKTNIESNQNKNEIKNDEFFYESELNTPASQPGSPSKDSQLTTAALSAHEKSAPEYYNYNTHPNQNKNQLSHQIHNQNTSRTERTNSALSTPRDCQLILRAVSSSPFSANTSNDGRIDILEGDEDTDFFLLARAKTAEVLRQRKLRKQRLRLASEKFNEKPLKADWMHFALSLGLIRPHVIITNKNNGDNIDNLENSSSEKLRDKENLKDKTRIKKFELSEIADAESVAKFLRNTPGDSKLKISHVCIFHSCFHLLVHLPSLISPLFTLFSILPSFFFPPSSSLFPLFFFLLPCFLSFPDYFFFPSLCPISYLVRFS